MFFGLDTCFGVITIVPTCANLPTKHDTWKNDFSIFFMYFHDQAPYIFWGGSRLMQPLLPTVSASVMRNHGVVCSEAGLRRS